MLSGKCGSFLLLAETNIIRTFRVLAVYDSAGFELLNRGIACGEFNNVL